MCIRDRHDRAAVCAPALQDGYPAEVGGRDDWRRDSPRRLGTCRDRPHVGLAPRGSLRRRLVAARRRLPGLYPQFRRRERRRYRRHRRDPEPSALPARPRDRRSLDHAWYPSPMADGGYDVADYRGIDPRLGSLADADQLLREAHENGIRVLIDLVPNHTSWSHPWFHDAVAAGPWSPARARYIFRDGRGPDGDEPPNNWQSAFGSSAWTRVVEPNGRPEQWYLHLFASEQPDLDWENPEVRAEFESILRFWFDRGFDGVRIDVADAFVKDPALPDMPPELSGAGSFPGEHPHWDRPGVHEIHRPWRRLADGYEPPRVLMGEIGVEDPERLSRYLRPCLLYTSPS